jgi:hypothetical protein
LAFTAAGLPSQKTESHPMDHDSNSSGHTKGKDLTPPVVCQLRGVGKSTSGCVFASTLERGDRAQRTPRAWFVFRVELGLSVITHLAGRHFISGQLSNRSHKNLTRGWTWGLGNCGWPTWNVRLSPRVASGENGWGRRKSRQVNMKAGHAGPIFRRQSSGSDLRDALIGLFLHRYRSLGLGASERELSQIIKTTRAA